MVYHQIDITLGMLTVVPKTFHKSVVTASGHAILKTSHQCSLHRGVDRHGKRSCHSMPWFLGEISHSEFDRLWSILVGVGYGWMEVGSECCLYWRCVLLEFHLFFMRQATVLHLKFLCKTFVLLLHLFWRTCVGKSQLANFYWQTQFFGLTEHDATKKCKCPWVCPICIRMHCCSCTNVFRFDCKRLSVSVGEMVRVRAKFRYTSASGKASKIASAIPCARPSYTPYFWRRVGISPHEILHFWHFRLHETQLFDSGRCRGWGPGGGGGM